MSVAAATATVAQPISDSDELLYIYITLRKLKCIQLKPAGGAEQKTVQLETQLFPRLFLLRQLNERLQSLDELAGEICGDLFSQMIGHQSPLPAAKSAKLTDQTYHQPAMNVGQNEANRYPEFDEYFHFCLHQLHDFMIGLHWHESDIGQLTKADSDYVSTNLEFVGYLFAFQRALFDLVREDGAQLVPSTFIRTAYSPPKMSTTTTNNTNEPNAQAAASQPPRAEGKKSNLRGSSPGKRDSPGARRRVRFKDLPPESVESSQGARRGPQQKEQNDLADQHSVLALDLLIYAINIYIQRLADSLIVWSASVQNELVQAIDSIFDSGVKVRAQQLRVIAKKIKIYNDVHLTVLDHLSSIKRTYLIKHIRGTLLSKDSNGLLFAYKDPRLKVYIQRIGLDVEVKILARLVKQCLQIFFNLIVCEINFDQIDGTKRRATGGENNKLKSQENITNFITNWLKVDDILFGVAKPPTTNSKTTATQGPERWHPNLLLLKQISPPPRLVAKTSTTTSTLSLSDKYASSSRILAQMDNLGEFMREFLQMIAQRLTDEQQLRYFLEAVSAGLGQFFDIVAPKLEQQLMEIKSRERSKSPPKSGSSETVASNQHGRGQHKSSKTPSLKAPPPPMELKLDLLLAKIRCLKFIHVIGLADRIVANEAIRYKVELGGDMEMDLKLARLTQICINSSKS